MNGPSIHGELLRLSAAEWARVGDVKLGAPEGPAVMGFAVGEAIHDRDPGARLMIHDEYRQEIAP